MAQTTLLMFNGVWPTFKIHSSLRSQIQRLVRPSNDPFSKSPLLPARASSLGLGFTTVALFKAKPNAPAKKQEPKPAKGGRWNFWNIRWHWFH